MSRMKIIETIVSEVPRLTFKSNIRVAAGFVHPGTNQDEREIAFFKGFELFPVWERNVASGVDRRVLHPSVHAGEVEGGSVEMVVNPAAYVFPA